MYGRSNPGRIKINTRVRLCHPDKLGTFIGELILKAISVVVFCRINGVLSNIANCCLESVLFCDLIVLILI